jgi:hypothetical protein
MLVLVLSFHINAFTESPSHAKTFEKITLITGSPGLSVMHESQCTPVRRFDSAAAGFCSDGLTGYFISF